MPGEGGPGTEEKVSGRNGTLKRLKHIKYNQRVKEIINKKKIRIERMFPNSIALGERIIAEVGLMFFISLWPVAVFGKNRVCVVVIVRICELL